MLTILRAIDDFLDQMAPALFIAAALFWLTRARRETTGAQALFPAAAAWLVTGGAMLAALVSVATFAANLIDPGYADHLLPLVTATSWTISESQPIHPLWEQGQGIYGLMYGPLLYEINAGVLAIMPSILGSKLLGTAAIMATFAVQYAAIRKLVADRALSRTVLLLSVVMLSAMLYVTMINRADPLLLLLAAISVALPLWSRSVWACAAIGVIAGVASGMKLHGLLYIAPAAAMIMWRDSRDLRAFIVRALAGSVAFLVTMALPFLHPAASLGHYATFMSMASQHHIAPDIVIANLTLGLAFLALPAIGFVLLRPRIAPEWSMLLGMTALCTLIVAIIAGKVGSGAPHMYPFVPLAILSLAVMLGTDASQASPARKTRAVTMLLLIALCTFGVTGVRRGGEYLVKVTERHDRFVQQRAELEALAARYPDAEMGATDKAHYDDSLQLPIIAFRNDRLTFHPGAWMDLQYARVPETYVVKMVEGCRVPKWILPAQGAPFSLENLLHDKLILLPDSFRQAFAQNYVRIAHGAHYDVWACRATPGR